MPLYQNCLNGSALLNEMATRAKIRKKKTLNDISIQANDPISKQFHSNVCLMPLHQNCLNGFAPLHKMATRAKNKKKKTKQKKKKKKKKHILNDIF